VFLGQLLQPGHRDPILHISDKKFLILVAHSGTAYDCTSSEIWKSRQERRLGQTEELASTCKGIRSCQMPGGEPAAAAGAAVAAAQQQGGGQQQRGSFFSGIMRMALMWGIMSWMKGSGVNQKAIEKEPHKFSQPVFAKVCS
jgi:hypothetical protein